jgi:hypothetical protein
VLGVNAQGNRTHGRSVGCSCARHLGGIHGIS